MALPSHQMLTLFAHVLFVLLYFDSFCVISCMAVSCWCVISVFVLGHVSAVTENVQEWVDTGRGC